METKPGATDETKKEEVKVKADEVAPTPAAVTEPKEPAEPVEEVEDVPDPDEDDLDDLDGELKRHHFGLTTAANSYIDMLDEFSTVKLDSKKPVESAGPAQTEPAKAPAAVAAAATTAAAAAAAAAAATAASTSDKQPVAEDDFSEEEFAKQLQAGMADLLGELETSVSRLLTRD